jgi:flagellar protein FliO/FliZ
MVGCFLSGSLRADSDVHDPTTSTLSPDTTLTPRSPSALFTAAPRKDSTQLVLYFVALVALAGGGLFLLKRGLPLRGLRNGENQLNLLETKMLGNRQFLVVVKYEDSKMLLGVGPGQIQYLCPLDSADQDMEILLRKSGGPPEVAPL